MNRSICRCVFNYWKTTAISILLIVIFVCGAQGVDFNASLRLRYDNGQEVDPASSRNFPDNLIDRAYIEGLFTADFLFKAPPIGDRFRVGLRMLKHQPSKVDGLLFNLKDERRFEDKIYAQLNWNRWEFWAGDVYETFGKGLALNLFENRDLYFDTGLRGSKTAYRSKSLRFKAIYGQSRAGYLVDIENVGGVNFEIRPTSDSQVGASVVHQEGLNYEERFTPEIYAGYEYYPFSIYAEYAQRRLENGNILAGDGIYSSLTAAVGGFAAQFSYKYYGFGVDDCFQTPPVVQREYTTKLMSSHPHLPLIDDQVGFEINLSAAPHDLVFLDLNFSRASRHRGADILPSLEQDYSPFWELFCEGEYYPRSDLTMKFGFGWNEESRINFWEEKIGTTTEIIYSFSGLWSITLAGEKMWVDDIQANLTHQEHWLSATLARAPFASLNISYENSTRDSDVEGNEWLSGEVAVTIISEHRLLLFYGRERGGLKCTSGICRPVQPFEGFRLTYDGRF
ncbi:MAG: hypothetical protein HQ591_02420 [candidate division Zixibacteria bacterium]|nr:hypothetical protein [Candidatus Tariuqbacter arcticus]